MSDERASEPRSPGSQIHRKQEWVWNDGTVDISNSIKDIAGIIPQNPIPLESLQNEINPLPKHIKEMILGEKDKIQKDKTQYDYICTGIDNNLPAHQADQETFMRNGLCKNCVYEAFDNFSKKQNKKSRKRKKADAVKLKIESEMSKMENIKIEELQGVLNSEFTEKGEDLKERLRGIGMGFHPENKSRKTNQFEHNSTLCYYAYGLKCLTLIYDPKTNMLHLVGAPEVKQELTEAADKTKENSKTFLEAGTNLIKRVFRSCPPPPQVTPSIQKTASTVWNNAFAKKRKSPDSDQLSDCSEDETENSPNPKRSGMESDIEENEMRPSEETDHEINDRSNKENGTEGEMTVLKGLILAVDESRTGCFKVCGFCKSINSLEKRDGELYWCQICSNFGKPLEQVKMVVKVKIEDEKTVEKLKTDVVLMKLEKNELVLLMDPTNPKDSDIIGGYIGPIKCKLNGDVWVKYD